jgi:hypothetical protein
LEIMEYHTTGRAPGNDECFPDHWARRSPIDRSRVIAALARDRRHC